MPLEGRIGRLPNSSCEIPACILELRKKMADVDFV